MLLKIVLAVVTLCGIVYLVSEASKPLSHPITKVVAPTPQDKPVVPEESPEHRFARLQLQNAIAHNQVVKKVNDEIERQTDEGNKIDESKIKRMINDNPTLGATQKEAMIFLLTVDFFLKTIDEDIVRARLIHVDACLTTFNVTINKKVSDLTVKESEEVTSCRVLDLYPPKTCLGQALTWWCQATSNKSN